MATRMPMAPRPTTPSVLPWISGPAKALLPFSTNFSTWSPWPFRVFTQSMAGPIFREVRNREASTSSFTALALAPGVLNTTMPFSRHLSTGMLFTPAPARAMASRFSPSSMSCMEAERTRMPSGFSISGEKV